MQNNRVHRVKAKETVRYFRLFPYDEIVEILSQDGSAFFEDSPQEPLKRQTVWKASRKLSEMMKKKVTYEHRLLKMTDGEQMAGYLFKVE